MRWTACGLMTFAVMLAVATARGQELPERGGVLKTLRAEHPRIIATGSDFENIARQCKTDPCCRKWLRSLRQQADELLTKPPVTYEIPDGKRLLTVSRTAKDRLLLLGLLHRLTGDAKYTRRAWQELHTVMQFKDWNPSHFLDTAEMTFAVAIGYDWLHDAWNDAQRTQLEAAIVRHGFEPGLQLYRQQKGWTQSVHNWNQVCNGGLAVGALAIGDVEPEIASEVLHSALASLPLAMRQFAPDGGWGEGPGYWRYATEYNVYLLAALATALHTDFGLSEMPGFAQTGDFPLHFVGPLGKTFNFADAKEGWSGAPQLFWLAQRFNQPKYALVQLPHADERPKPLDLIWGASVLGKLPTKNQLPTSACFRGVNVVTMRSDWHDPRATFAAFKGGDNRVNHGHLDLGTFVLDARGQRWAFDLGGDDYNLPGYFGPQRWTYLRNNTHSHNTLIIDGQNQSPTAHAKVLRFAANDGWSSGVVDLTDAWPQLTRAWRGVALQAGRKVIVQDEVSGKQPVIITWQMLTDAEIKIDGRTAILTKEDERITAELVAPQSARWQVAEFHTEAPQREVLNTRRLFTTLPQTASDVRLIVVFDTTAQPGKQYNVTPLEQWPGLLEQ